MQSLLYFTLHDMSDTTSGVTKKIYSQLKSFSKKRNVYLACMFKNNFVIMDQRKNILININIFTHKYIEKKRIYNLLEKFIINKRINNLYIRHFFVDAMFILFLKNIKKLNIWVGVEIPTYPYDLEVNSIIKKIFLNMDKFYRRFLYKYISYIITYSSDDYIFGIKCINISNGLDEEQILNNRIEDYNNDKLTFISVSSVFFWHGLDRFICGMNDYYINGGKESIILYIVGPENHELMRLKNLVNKFNLEENIKFLGYLSGSDLESYYLKSNIGLGSLGRHRSGISQLSSLKNKEYCAKGIPFIYSEFDKDFDGENFTFRLAPNETNIDINLVLDWYKGNFFKSSEIINFSKKFLWDYQIDKILNSM